MECYSVEQLAEVLGISRTKAYELVHQKGFPAVRIGEKRVVIPRAGLEEWLAEKSKERI